MKSGRLHPRLLEAQAEQRFEELRSLSLDEIRARARTEDAAAVFAATGAPRITRDELTDLEKGVRAATDEYGYPVTPGRDAARGFDRTLAGVYLDQGRLSPAEASSQEVWSFHALVLLPDVAYWRFRSESGDTNKERLVGSDLTRHAFGRLWWRALVLCMNPDGGVDEDGLKRLTFLARRTLIKSSPGERHTGSAPGRVPGSC